MSTAAQAAVCACGGDTKVIDSRVYGPTGRRRRECLRCGLRWTTYEVRAESPVRMPSAQLTDILREIARVQAVCTALVQQLEADLSNG